MLAAWSGKQGGFWGTLPWSVRTSQPGLLGLLALERDDSQNAQRGTRHHKAELHPDRLVGLEHHLHRAETHFSRNRVSLRTALRKAPAWRLSCTPADWNRVKRGLGREVLRGGTMDGPESRECLWRPSLGGTQGQITRL
jgi:hypothetical protein